MSQADLEISLYPRDAEGYGIELRFSDPDSEAEKRQGGVNPVRFDPNELRQLQEHTVSVNSVAYNPDGKTIVTASYDKTARIWIASIDELLAEAARLIQRDPPIFTPEERQTYGLE